MFVTALIAMTWHDVVCVFKHHRGIVPIEFKGFNPVFIHTEQCVVHGCWYTWVQLVWAGLAGERGFASA